MKKLFILLLGTLSLAVSGCSSTLQNVQTQADQAVSNIQKEASNVTSTVTQKVDQVNKAVNSVNQAVSDIKAVGN